MVKFKEFTGACKQIQRTGKEEHNVVEYLVDSNRLDAGCIGINEDTGTLSHRLIVELARFEEEMAQEAEYYRSGNREKDPD